MKFSFSSLLVFTITTTLLISQAAAQVVEIPDPNLREAIQQALELPAGTPITRQDMEKLEYLDNEKTEKMGITDLTGLEYATNLNAIPLNQNEITDLTPLSNLIQLESLAAWGNPISDISPLANLTQLRNLDLAGCDVADISPLANLTQLKSLNLGWNRIQDINVLANLINLERLRLYGNPIHDYSPLDELSLTVLERDEICQLPALPIETRLRNRTFPSVFSAWTGFRLPNRPELSRIERWTLHDLHWHSPYFGLHFSEISQGWKVAGNIEEAQATRDEFLALNPNMIFLVEVRMRDATISPDYPEDFPYWLRDPNGNLIKNSPESNYYLIDFTQPGMQDIIVQQTVAVAQCGLFDGIFFDWWKENHPVIANSDSGWNEGYRGLEVELNIRDDILQRIRSRVREDFLILGNTNRSKIPRTAWAINGTFMETLRDNQSDSAVKPNDSPYTVEGLIEIEDTLLWAEANLREPQVNCLEGWGIPTQPPDSPKNKQFMRVFTTMSLTHSDGYVLYGMDNSHEHIWYDFWDTDLGYPIGPKAQPYQNIDGLFIREFTNGWAVYNRSGNEQTITLTRVSTGVSSNKQDITHLLPDLDGEIYLRKGKPFDLNRDGTVNILDLILVSQAFNTTEGDINGDGTTNILDLTLVAQQFNK